MPIFIYQSLNSNASSEHNVAAANGQYFTNMAHNSQSAISQPWSLSMPTAPQIDPHVPVQGPAQLIPSGERGYMKKGQHSDATFLSMVENKARQIHQHIYRAFGACDLLVFGELDGGHAAWASMAAHAGPIVASATTGKACNSFSVHSRGVNNAMLGQGMGWIAIRSYNINVVFVHVPNVIAKSVPALVDFYRSINNFLVQNHFGPIDLVMGDTNQSSPGVTPKALIDALGYTFRDAHPSNDIQPLDAHQQSFGGTNSTGSKKYDVAVYNTETLRVENVGYLTQVTPVSDTGDRFTAAITDHMGIGIQVFK